jgi:hypothetical protein
MLYSNTLVLILLLLLGFGFYTRAEPSSLPVSIYVYIYIYVSILIQVEYGICTYSISLIYDSSSKLVPKYAKNSHFRLLMPRQYLRSSRRDPITNVSSLLKKIVFIKASRQSMVNPMTNYTR